MSYCEKNFQTEFGRRNKHSGLFELKIVKGKSFRFDQLQPHQRRALLNAQGKKGCFHKLSDMSWDQKPFDCFNIKNYPAYVVVMFYEIRKKKNVYYVPIYDLNAIELIVAPKKRIKEDDVKEAAKFIEDYTKN